MSELPAGLHEPVRAALRSAGDETPIRSLLPVGGGCINNGQRLETGQSVYFLKWNPAPLPGMFAAEARGLELMRATSTVRVPAVYATAEAAPGAPAFILLEYLQGSAPRGGGQEILGRQLAQMHLSPAPAQYGLDQDNYIGSTPQINAWESDWVTFYREHRLRYQMELAARSGRLNGQRRAQLDQLLARLPELLGGLERRPALLHGDLWGGNVIPGPDGQLALIDPAVYYGDREAEIAFTELFGGFSDAFYRAYQEVYPLDPGFSDRRDLYNLYHLLNHLNLFGEGYGGQVDRMLRRYVL
jgi:protein-ribulosamine 3-kinase